MWRLPPTFVDEARLAAAWRSAAPFPHVVVDDFVTDDRVAELYAILEEEPVETYAGDIFTFDATGKVPRTEALAALRDELAATFAPVLSRLTGKAITRADMRAYAYRPGHYLLPHTDHQEDVGRVVAYAYYLPSPEPPEDGALELFTCGPDHTTSAKIIEPRANRAVFFEVSDVSLHQVREVLAGLRVSLAGWFYP